MDTPRQFRKYAADCETMSKVSRDRRQLEEKRSKPHRNPHAWEARQA